MPRVIFHVQQAVLRSPLIVTALQKGSHRGDTYNAVYSRILGQEEEIS
jgi:hypothetical protein